MLCPWNDLFGFELVMMGIKQDYKKKFGGILYYVNAYVLYEEEFDKVLHSSWIHKYIYSLFISFLCVGIEELGVRLNSDKDHQNSSNLDSQFLKMVV